jgi:hypothetical protein
MERNLTSIARAIFSSFTEAFVGFSFSATDVYEDADEAVEDAVSDELGLSVEISEDEPPPKRPFSLPDYIIS